MNQTAAATPSQRQAAAPVVRGRWSELFTKNRVCSDDTTLTLMRSPGNKIALTPTDVDAMEGKFGFCLVGRFLGRFPGWKALKALTGQWATPHQTLTHDSVWIDFKFSEKQSCDTVLKGGPYVIYGCPLYLKNMPHFFTFESAVHNQLPLWMQIHGLPIDCWTRTGLSKVALAVGVPMYTDRFTKSRERINFARVLVEVDVTAAPPSTIEVTLPNGREVQLRLHFESVLKLCTVCRQLGHYLANCPRRNQGHQ